MKLLNVFLLITGTAISIFLVMPIMANAQGTCSVQTKQVDIPDQDYTCCTGCCWNYYVASTYYNCTIPGQIAAECKPPASSGSCRCTGSVYGGFCINPSQLGQQCGLGAKVCYSTFGYQNTLTDNCEINYSPSYYTGTSPAGCGLPSNIGDCTCVKDACDCTSWSDQGCGKGGCTSDKMYQTRSCTPGGCSSTSQCVADPSCGASPPPPPPPPASPTPNFTIENLDYPGVKVVSDSGAKMQGSNFKFDASSSTSSGSLQFRWNFNGGGWDTVWLDSPVYTKLLSPNNKDPGAVNRHQKNIVLEVKDPVGNTAQKTRTINLYYLDVEAWFPSSGAAPFTPASSVRFYVDSDLSTPTPWYGSFKVTCNGATQGCHNQSRKGCQGGFFSNCLSGGYWGEISCEETKIESSSSNYTEIRTYGDISCSTYTTPGNAGITLQIEGLTISGVSVSITKTVPITIISNLLPSTRLTAVYPSGAAIAQGNTQNITVNQGSAVTFTAEAWDCDGLVDLQQKTTNITGGSWINSNSTICSFSGNDYSVYDDGGPAGIVLSFPTIGDFSYNVFAQDKSSSSSTSKINVKVQAIPNSPPYIPKKVSIGTPAGELPQDSGVKEDDKNTVALTWQETKINNKRDPDGDNDFSHYEIWYNRAGAGWKAYDKSSGFGSCKGNLTTTTCNFQLGPHGKGVTYQWNVIAIDKAGIQSHKPECGQTADCQCNTGTGLCTIK